MKSRTETRNSLALLAVDFDLPMAALRVAKDITRWMAGLVIESLDIIIDVFPTNVLKQHLQSIPLVLALWMAAVCAARPRSIKLEKHPENIRRKVTERAEGDVL
jgi:hypothetical protein